jgi:colanic acid biosynthesis glycosyl transferase WcaI
MRILIYSYNYHPEPIGIAPLMTELAEGLVQRAHEVRVVTAMPNYPERQIYPEYRGRLFSKTTRNGVMIQRSFVWIKPNPNLLDRLFLDASFVITSLFQALRGWRPDVILTTSPPLPVSVPSLLLRWIYRAPIVLNLQDILPEAAVRVGLLTNKHLIKIFEKLERFSYRSADAISVICEAFTENLRHKQVPESKLNLIPNWVNTNFICPLPKESSPFRQAHNLQDKFVVMYSGNIALTQGMQTVIAAARLLQPLPKIVVVIVGESKALAELEQLCHKNNVQNVVLVPFQPRDQLPQMLAAADVGLILQKHNVVSFNMPSKIPVLLASGRAIIASVPIDGTAARSIRRSGGGIVVAPENPAALAHAIQSLYHDPRKLQRLATQGRIFAEKTYASDPIINQYETLLFEVIDRTYRSREKNSSGKPEVAWRSER